MPLKLPPVLTTLPRGNPKYGDSVAVSVTAALTVRRDGDGRAKCVTQESHSEHSGSALGSSTSHPLLSTALV